MSEIAIETQQADLLQKAEYYIAQKVCKKYNYSRVGRETQFLTDDMVALRNFEFVLCGKGDFTCEQLDCIACALLHLKN